MSCQITYDTSTWPSGDRVWDVCRAIAIAEGANDPGSVPDKYNNPGDLSRGDEHGQSVAGYVTLGCGEGEIIFSTKQDGWDALYKKISAAASGSSKIYLPSLTWAQVASHYAKNSVNWLANVTKTLGVSASDTLGGYVNG